MHSKEARKITENTKLSSDDLELLKIYSAIKAAAEDRNNSVHYDLSHCSGNCRGICKILEDNGYVVYHIKGYNESTKIYFRKFIISW